MPPSPDPAARIVALIAADGPITIERYMALCNAHYYATRDPFGTGGDFTTAPEISQMFGELIGLCLADLWQRAGRPDCALVELGPGRGTLARDARRAMAVAGLTPAIHLVETSPVLCAAQRRLHPGASWHDTIDTLPEDRPLLIVANEFFDALPIRQFERTAAGWCERLVGGTAEALAFVHGPAMDGPDLPLGTVIERNSAGAAIAAALAARLGRQGGVLLAIDYGYQGGSGDTLQAVRAHAFANALAAPGMQDLTAHVDFAALAAAGAGARILGPIAQGQFLVALGIAGRAAALARAAPDRADETAAAYARLTAPDAMGTLFKVLGMVAPHWPDPAGFA